MRMRRIWLPVIHGNFDVDFIWRNFIGVGVAVDVAMSINVGIAVSISVGVAECVRVCV